MKSKIEEIQSLLLRMDAPNFQIRFYHRILFCFILGLLSFFFAETISGATTNLFRDWFTFFYTFPLYLFHVVVLGWVVLKATDGRPSLATLFVAGGIFGLYEAYITKVMWDPTWSPDLTVKIFGVSLVHTLILCFFFHNFFAFIIPLLVAETLLTNFGHKPIMNCLPPRLKYIFENRRNTTLVLLIIFAIYGGIYSSSDARHNPLVALSGLTIILLGLLIALWRRLIKYKEVTMLDLFPNNVGFVVCAGCLIVVYTFGTMMIRPNLLPRFFNGQFLVILLYLLFITVFIFCSVNCRFQEILRPLDENTCGNYSTFNKVESQSLKFSWGLFAFLSVLFVGLAIAASYAEPYIMIPIFVSLLIGTAFGLFLFGVAVTQAVAGAKIFWKTKL